MAAVVTLTGCAAPTPGGGRLRVVASFYPLAWAADRVGGDRVSVVDLTPPGGEAHDSQMTAVQRGELQQADLVLYLGPIGFQPDLERAVDEVSGRVVDAAAVPLRRTSEGTDPHLWLNPVAMDYVARTIADALVALDPAGASGYRERRDELVHDLKRLDRRAEEAGLGACPYRAFVTTHDAFFYLARQYGLREIAVEGFRPETEPSADRIQAALDAISSGVAGPAVFFEPTDEGKRIGEGISSDAGVPTLALGTLEAQPSKGDYLSVMRENLSHLEEGLGCR